ncbi:MAG TPA: GNAT family N-acetyltransferase [Verrucomicrobiales bacterium]|nr:GNAT family N-acetyltransferase [Verrucomicrobiales bacterium]
MTTPPRPLPDDAQVVTITYLEMRERDAVRPRPCPDPRFQVREATVKQWRFNKFLYTLVGNDWKWFDKLKWTDEQWRDYAEADSLRTFPAWYDGSPAGYFELRSDANNDVEIAYFGLSAPFIGRGFGGYLLSVTLQEAWAMAPRRVWVHTCSLDHPSALANYQARGLRSYREEIVLV